MSSLSFLLKYRNAATSHVRVNRNTWAGPSDLCAPVKKTLLVRILITLNKSACMTYI